ncbi:hypothetical protein TNCV_3792511 [Trichonephila clavipes]|nr:hypothetical protein TNCV_3792511 [Trichonephila clavipes]
MAAVDFLHQENPPTWAGVEPATLGTEGQRQTNQPTPLQPIIKYLGVYFSKLNQNGAFMNQMKNKALKKINTFKDMAYKHYCLRAEIKLTNRIYSTFFTHVTLINGRQSTQTFQQYSNQISQNCIGPSSIDYKHRSLQLTR